MMFIHIIILRNCLKLFLLIRNMQYLLVLLYFLSLQFDNCTAILSNNKFFRQIDYKHNPYTNK